MVFDTTVFIFAVIGGALAELLKWWQLKETPNMPVYAKNPIYWTITVLMMLAGGVLALAQGVDATKPLLALNIGISAPLILKGLAASTPQSSTRRLPGADEQPAPSILDFIAGR